VLRAGTVYKLIGENDEKLVVKCEAGNLTKESFNTTRAAIKQVDQNAAETKLLGAYQASEPQVELVQPLILFLLLDVRVDHRLVPPHCGHEISRGRPKMLPNKTPLALTVHPRQVNGLLPMMYPITCDTAYFGGIAISMCT